MSSVTPPEVESSNRRHLYFIQALQDWHDQLSNLLSNLRSVPSSASPAPESSATTLPDDSDSGFLFLSQNRLLHPKGNALLEDSIRFALSCFIIDLEDLFDHVSQLWASVKQRETSFLVGSAVSVMAIRLVASFEAKLRLQYPSIRSFEHLLHALDHLFTEKLFKDSEATPWNSRLRILHHLIMTWKVFGGILDAMPRQSSTAMLAREGMYGPPYNEENAPLRQKPLDFLRFLQMELAKMYNVYMADPLQGLGRQLPSLHQCVEHLGKSMDSKFASIQSIFTIAIWIRSLEQLQGQRFLSHTIVSLNSNSGIFVHVFREV